MAHVHLHCPLYGKFRAPFALLLDEFAGLANRTQGALGLPGIAGREAGHCTGSTTTSLPRWWTQPHSQRGRGSARRRSPSTPRSSTSATSLAGPRECPTHSPSTWWSLSMPTSWLPLLTPTRCNPEWRANAHPMPARASQGRKLQKKIKKKWRNAILRLLAPLGAALARRGALSLELLVLAIRLRHPLPLSRRKQAPLSIPRGTWLGLCAHARVPGVSASDPLLRPLRHAIRWKHRA